MRKYLLILASLLLGCDSDRGKPDLITDTQIAKLKKENDSLKRILKNKFLFDQIAFKIIPSDETPNYNQSNFEGKFVLIGYNKNDYLLLNGEYDRNTRQFHNSDTIIGKKGNYFFSIEKDKADEVAFYIALDKTYGSKTYDSIITIPFENLWGFK